jgi:hypothetical protein
MIIKISQSLRSFEMTRLILKSSTRSEAHTLGHLRLNLMVESRRCRDEATRDLTLADIQDSTSHTPFHQKQYLIKSNGEK